MFALTPQTIMMLEGQTPLASSPDPAGETGGGSDFARVMGASEPPATVNAGQGSSVVFATLADPVWPAPLLAWPTQAQGTPPLIAPHPAQNMDITVNAPASAGVSGGDAGIQSDEPPLGGIDNAVIVELVSLPYLDTVHGLPKVSDLPQGQPDATGTDRWVVGGVTDAQVSAAQQPAPNGSVDSVAGFVVPQTIWLAAPVAAQTAPENAKSEVASEVPQVTHKVSAKTAQRGQGVPYSGGGVVTDPADVAQHIEAYTGDGRTAHASQNSETPKPARARVAGLVVAPSAEANNDLPMSEGPVGDVVRGPGTIVAASHSDRAPSIPATPRAKLPSRSVTPPMWPTGPAAITARQSVHPETSPITASASATLIPSDDSADAPRQNREAVTVPTGMKTSPRGIDAPVEVLVATEKVALVVKRPVIQPAGGQTQLSLPRAEPALAPRVGGFVAIPNRPQSTRTSPAEMAGTKAQNTQVDFAIPSYGAVSLAGASMTEKEAGLISAVTAESQKAKTPLGRAPQSESAPDLNVPAVPSQSNRSMATDAWPAPVRSAANWTLQPPSVPAVSPKGHPPPGPAPWGQTMDAIGPDPTLEPMPEQKPIRVPVGPDGSAKAEIRPGEHRLVSVSGVETPDALSPYRPLRRNQPAMNPRDAGQMAMPHRGMGPATSAQTDRLDIAAIPPDRRIWSDKPGLATGRSVMIDAALPPADAKAAIKKLMLTQGTVQADPRPAAPQQTAPAHPARPVARGGTEYEALPKIETDPMPIVVAPGSAPANQAPKVERIVAVPGVEKPISTPAVRPVAPPLVADLAGPQPAIAPIDDLPAPQPSFASFWQVPTASHGWQTALQFWTPPAPIAKSLVRTTGQPSAGSAQTVPPFVPMDLAAPLKVAQPVQGDNRPPPISAKRSRDTAPDNPAPPSPLPIVPPLPAAPPSGPVLTLQSATSGEVDRSLAHTALPATSPTSLSAPIVPMPPMPKGLPDSLARAAKEERTELLLDPVELGKVRFELVTTGDKVQINLSVERPETLDLLRRNIDSLHREFRDAGFDTATLNFGQWGKGQEEGRQTPLTAQFGDGPDLPDTAPAPIAKPNRNTSSQGLDLRM